VNIVQFAKVSGLSTATVSRAFSEPEKVRKSTREHVLALAEQLHYYPSPSGRTLVLGRYDTLGLIWPLEVEGASAPFAHRVLVALTESLIENDLDLLICPVQREQPSAVLHAERSLRRSRCDAWILLYPRHNDFLIRPLQMSHKPVICLMGPLAECPDWKSVVVNQRMWIEDALKRLRANGANRVLFLGCRLDEPDHRERLDRFTEIAPKYFGENFQSLPIWPVNVRSILPLLSAERFDAIIGVDDMAALVGMAACQELKLSVPEDVQILGIDGCPEAIAANLTTYRQPLEEMTAHAVELALGRAHNSEVFNPIFVPGGTLRS
jgi:DNA-binding LacI/PurR family transcriptional regulator